MRFTPPVRFLRICTADAQGRAGIGPRQIYILPTRYGLGFALLLFLLLAGSINYAINLGFLFTFLLSGLGLVSMLHTWRNLVGLQLWSGEASPVFAGQEARFTVSLFNPRRVEHPGIRLQLSASPLRCADLPAGQVTNLTLDLAAEARGPLNLPRITVSTRYPLGLFHAWSYVDLKAGCLVYPAPGPRIPPSDLPYYNPSHKGDRGVGADDFVGLRRYRPGDSPRHINWKVTARTQQLQTKQFGGDRAERRWLEWDALQGLATEARLSALCRGVLDACDQQQEFGLRLPGETINPGRGPAQRHQCLAALALYGKTA